MTNVSHAGTGHLNELEIAAYLDRALDGGDLTRVEAHLAACSECRSTVASVESIVTRRRFSRTAAYSGMLVAAVAVLAIAIPTVRSSGNRSITRDLDAPSMLSTYSPAATSARSDLKFIWASSPSSPEYHFTLSESDGQPVFATQTADTVLILPHSLHLETDRPYVWSVEAELPGGETRSTGLIPVSITEARL